jgi:hypothetical protein
LDFFLLPRNTKGTLHPLKHYHSRKDWSKIMGRPRKKNPNPLSLLLETGDTQHSAKTSSRQKELEESSLEWKRHVTRK